VTAVGDRVVGFAAGDLAAIGIPQSGLRMPLSTVCVNCRNVILLLTMMLKKWMSVLAIG
jgi:hypothetical protein